MPAAITEKAATYIERVNALYDQIEAWLSAIDPGAQKPQRGSIVLNEESAGEYEAPTMEFHLSNGRTVRLAPRGSDWFACAGRVEIDAIGREALVYIDGNPVVSVGAGENERVVSLRNQTGDGWAWARDKLKHDIPSLDEPTFRDLIRRIRA